MGSKYSKTLLLAALAALPAGIAITWIYFWPDANLMEPQGFYFGRDFLNYWTGGRLALTGPVEVAYDLERYNALLRAWFSPEQSGMAFSYPPHALPLLAPFGALPYLAAYALWCLAGAAGFAAVCLGRAPTREDATLVAAIALAPVVWVNIVFGQMGLLLALLFVGALRALPSRPVLAGVLIGVLTIKPQLGLLLPFLLLLMGAWRTIAAAAVTTIALAALSLALYGLEPWQLYVSQTMPLQWTFVTRMDGFYTNQMITPYTALWNLGVPASLALTLQAAIAIAIAFVTLLALRSSASWALKCAVVAFGSVLMVPYVLAYDLAIPLAALVWHLVDDDPDPHPAGLALAGSLWALPYALTILLQVSGVPVLPIVLVASFFWLAGEALGWRPFAQVKAAFAGLRA
jgi:hypothetical protein